MKTKDVMLAVHRWATRQEEKMAAEGFYLCADNCSPSSLAQWRLPFITGDEPLRLLLEAHEDADGVLSVHWSLGKDAHCQEDLRRMHLVGCATRESLAPMLQENLDKIKVSQLTSSIFKMGQQASRARPAMTFG